MRMYTPDMRHIAKFALIPGLLVLLTACAEGVSWEQREIDNGQRLLDAIAATNEAARLANQPGNNDAEVLTALRRALVAAVQVDDQVLDKLHPALQPRFRFGFQRALGKMVRAYERGKPQAAEAAAGELQEFINWYRAHRQDFRWWEGAHG